MPAVNAVKGPHLVCLDFKAGTGRRYQKKFDSSGAGLGWQVAATHYAEFAPADPPGADAIEFFRKTGG